MFQPARYHTLCPLRDPAQESLGFCTLFYLGFSAVAVAIVPTGLAEESFRIPLRLLFTLRKDSCRKKSHDPLCHLAKFARIRPTF